MRGDSRTLQSVLAITATGVDFLERIDEFAAECGRAIARVRRSHLPSFSSV
jgi:hypothetical protein